MNYSKCVFYFTKGPEGQNNVHFKVKKKYIINRTNTSHTVLFILLIVYPVTLWLNKKNSTIRIFNKRCVLIKIQLKSLQPVSGHITASPCLWGLKDSFKVTLWSYAKSSLQPLSVLEQHNVRKNRPDTSKRGTAQLKLVHVPLHIRSHCNPATCPNTRDGFSLEHVAHTLLSFSEAQRSIWWIAETPIILLRYRSGLVLSARAAKRHRREYVQPVSQVAFAAEHVLMGNLGMHE